MKTSLVDHLRPGPDARDAEIAELRQENAELVRRHMLDEDALDRAERAEAALAAQQPSPVVDDPRDGSGERVTEAMVERMAIFLAVDHAAYADGYSWDATDDVWKASFRNKARAALEAALAESVQCPAERDGWPRIIAP